MSNGALSIPISADASKFLKTLATVKNEIKGLKEELETASGTRVAEIRFEITGLERMKKAYGEFGNYAEGTYGRLLQQLDYLNAYKLTLKVDSQEFVDTVEKLKVVNNLIDTANGKKIKIKTEVEAPPTGSIKDIENSIKKYKGLRDIAVDSSSLEQFNQIIQRLEERLSRLKSAGIEIPAPQIDEEPLANSIAGIRKQIRSLEAEKANIDIDDQGSIAKLNTQIDQLEDKIKKADRVGFDSKGKITENAGKARQALTNLTLVAQDLPFGFIAIQNNLPNLFESFNQLKNQSNGVKGAFKEFGKQLIGPGGFFFLFSAVTSAVTYAVKEYGSLGAAIDALFGRFDPLNAITMRASKSLSEYNKNLVTNGEALASANGSMQGQIIKAKALASVVLNLNESESKRKIALQELKKLDKDRFDAYDIESGKLQGLAADVDNYSKAIIASAIARKFADRVADVAEQTELQRNKLNEYRKELAKLYKDVPNIVELYNNYTKALENQRRVEEAVIQLDRGGASPNVQKFLKFTEAIKQGKLEVAQLEAQWAAAEQTALNYAKAELQFQKLDPNKGGGRKAKAKEKVDNSGLIALRERIKRQNYLNKIELKGLRDAYKERRKVEREEGVNALVPGQIALAPPSLNIDYEKLKRDGEIARSIIDGIQTDLANQFTAVRETLSEVFFAPLTDLFTSFFEKGKFAFADFGKAILNTIKQLAAKILATGIINLLANILLPGGGAAASAIGKNLTGAGGGILGAFGAAFKSVLGLKQVSNPNFAGVQGGGMQLAGEVVFRQRGSDLVGVINRTNGTISRVG